MNGFNDKGLQKIWDSIGLPADIRMQEEFEQLVCEWEEADIIHCKDCTKCETVTTKKGTEYHCTEFECPICGSFVDVDEFGYCAWGERREE